MTSPLRGLALLLALPAAVAAGRAYRTPAPHTHEVLIQGFKFHPSTITVAAGDTLRFVNRDPVPHTATARDSTWDSGPIAPGATWAYVAPDTGDDAFFCRFHPVMLGRLQVR